MTKQSVSQTFQFKVVPDREMNQQCFKAYEEFSQSRHILPFFFLLGTSWILVAYALGKDPIFGLLIVLLALLSPLLTFMNRALANKGRFLPNYEVTLSESGIKISSFMALRWQSWSSIYEVRKFKNYWIICLGGTVVRFSHPMLFVMPLQEVPPEAMTMVDRFATLNKAKILEME